MHANKCLFSLPPLHRPSPCRQPTICAENRSSSWTLDWKFFLSVSVFSLVLPRTFSYSCAAASNALYAWHAHGCFYYMNSHSHTLNEQCLLARCSYNFADDLRLLDVQICSYSYQRAMAYAPFCITPIQGGIRGTRYRTGNTAAQQNATLSRNVLIGQIYKIQMHNAGIVLWGNFFKKNGLLSWLNARQCFRKSAFSSFLHLFLGLIRSLAVRSISPYFIFRRISSSSTT